MNEFDQQDAELFEMVHRNPYRTGVKTTIGYVVTPAEYQEYMDMKSKKIKRRKNPTPGFMNIFASAIAALIFIVTALSALI